MVSYNASDYSSFILKNSPKIYKKFYDFTSSHPNKQTFAPSNSISAKVSVYFQFWIRIFWKICFKRFACSGTRFSLVFKILPKIKQKFDKHVNYLTVRATFWLLNWANSSWLHVSGFTIQFFEKFLVDVMFRFNASSAKISPKINAKYTNFANLQLKKTKCSSSKGICPKFANSRFKWGFLKKKTVSNYFPTGAPNSVSC